MKLKEYCFPENPKKTGYCVFPEELENDELVLFHGTLASNLTSVLKYGFKIPSKCKSGGLSSVSFAMQSSMALGHICQKFAESSEDLCILVVRYEGLDRKGLCINVSDVHDFTLDPPPEVIGYCKVPTTYQHH